MKKRSGFGWVECISGICMLLLGVFTLFNPGDALTGFAFVYGIVAVITGVCDIVFYIKAERYTGFGPVVALISGILSTMAGFILLAHPGTGKWIVSILFPLWFIAHCISRLAHANVIRFTSGTLFYYFSLIVNALGLIMGIVMLFEPVFTWVAAGTIIGIYLIASGVESIVIACSKMGSR